LADAWNAGVDAQNVALDAWMLLEKGSCGYLLLLCHASRFLGIPLFFVLFFFQF